MIKWLKKVIHWFVKHHLERKLDLHTPDLNIFFYPSCVQRWRYMCKCLTCTSSFLFSYFEYSLSPITKSSIISTTYTCNVIRKHIISITLAASLLVLSSVMFELNQTPLFLTAWDITSITLAASLLVLSSVMFELNQTLLFLTASDITSITLAASLLVLSSVMFELNQTPLFLTAWDITSITLAASFLVLSSVMFDKHCYCLQLQISQALPLLLLSWFY